MLNVGLTGGIGAGKSEVTKRFAALGAKVIDADAIAREVVEPGTPGLAAVVAEFGAGVQAADGSLDRDAVAAIVFADDDARARLNAIVHPLIGERVAALLAEYDADDPDGILINDVPLIAEAGVAERYEVIIVVDAPVEVQLDRLVRLRGMTREAAQARIDVQASREQRLALATHVLTNDGDLDSLQAQVDQVWQALHARSK
ncbi:MAG TPA: dephospho-CoA kinase [Mycobacteriales bacterium]|nr:dephospho-CoA kinase [Mycobacteriales bacterium]HWA68184.1 dephospho-CoA kinase [Mycobacteriales bacterium]